ncbi:hypothetical protein SAMN05428966_108321 [Massilia sp. PDC64]|nr:hypothetical protein [Massilia sp. PDC64]SDE44841.1 hypothetical protein SAMN05428966_108321 [Massilia sp. PDC64]
MNEYAAPIASLIAKSDKARQKLAPGTWQYRMLDDNLNALRIAAALMSGASAAPGRYAPDDLRVAVRAFASMIARSETAEARATPGTAQHALLRNRLAALRAAQTMIVNLLERA